MIDAFALPLVATGTLLGTGRAPYDDSTRLEMLLTALVLNAAALVLWNAAEGWTAAMRHWLTALPPLLALRLALHWRPRARLPWLRIAAVMLLAGLAPLAVS